MNQYRIKFSRKATLYPNVFFFKVQRKWLFFWLTVADDMPLRTAEQLRDTLESIDNENAILPL